MEIAENISVEKVRAENDEAWNRVLNIYFKDFVEFFWPQAYQAIDWSKYYEPLEQELLQLTLKEKLVNAISINYLRFFLRMVKNSSYCCILKYNTLKMLIFQLGCLLISAGFTIVINVMLLAWRF
jgi:hypothetical protein